MSRFGTYALAAMLALGSLTIATQASAHGGRFGGGHWGGGHFGHGFAFHRGFGFHRGFWGRPYYGYYSSAGCWRWHRVWTPYGWRLQRSNVCYYPYY